MLEKLKELIQINKKYAFKFECDYCIVLPRNCKEEELKNWALKINSNFRFTGKSMSEALILESVNHQYDKRLFIEFQEKYKFTTCCVQK